MSACVCARWLAALCLFAVPGTWLFANNGTDVVADTVTLRQVDVTDDRVDGGIITHMDDVGNGVIHAAKKTELVRVKELTANTSTNNSRQVLSSVVGLNIWESDAMGLQLGIGGRGLSPDRTSNFTTRQNGYDIAADPLGYPESYYTPPMDALERIEVIRGGAALRYGTQFGGVVNFVTIEPSRSQPLATRALLSGGSYGFASAFLNVGGGSAGVSYNAWYQYRRSDGWRPNSGADQHTANAMVLVDLSDKVRLRADYTFMTYLAQQPGGLSDVMFEQDPQQSVRARNWFTVQWNVASARLDVIIDTLTTLRSTLSGMASGRTALGDLKRITMVDLGGPRTMIDGTFLNIANETTITRDIPLLGQLSTIAAGMRLFAGRTIQQQGNASAGSGPDFAFSNPDHLEGSDYTFPNLDGALFAEGVLRLGGGWQIVPGVRVEHINTRAQGWYRVLVNDLAGNTVVDTMISENRERSRTITLFGMGASWRAPFGIEFYGNAVQNYRAITFTDLRVVNPNLVVDPNIQDERGYTLDLGARSAIQQVASFDVSVFYLRYNNKIGEVLRSDQAPLYLPYRYRSNIADAYTAGIEAVADVDVGGIFNWKALNAEAPSLHILVNGSVMDGRYVSTDNSAIANKKVELVPNYVARVGANVGWHEWSVSVLQSWVGEQFTDATNTEFSASAVTGVVPAYAVLDVSARYTGEWLRVTASANNLLNARYFSRRAVSYPGPGIIPAEPLTLVLSVAVDLPVIR
jgi:Fe(3+) dicitrate transport protein